VNEYKEEKDLALISLFDSEGHLTPSVLAALCCGSLCDEAAIAALTHIGACAVCADDYASVLEQGILCDPPAGFTEMVQVKLETEELLTSAEEAKPAEQIPIARSTGEKSIKKTQSSLSFTAYAFRVALAAGIALVVTFSGFAMSGNKSATTAKAPDFSFVNSVSNRLKAFSQSVLNMEGFHNAKTKK